MCDCCMDSNRKCDFSLTMDSCRCNQFDISHFRIEFCSIQSLESTKSISPLWRFGGNGIVQHCSSAIKLQLKQHILFIKLFQMFISQRSAHYHHVDEWFFRFGSILSNRLWLWLRNGNNEALKSNIFCKQRDVLIRLLNQLFYRSIPSAKTGALNVCHSRYSLTFIPLFNVHSVCLRHILRTTTAICRLNSVFMVFNYYYAINWRIRRNMSTEKSSLLKIKQPKKLFILFIDDFILIINSCRKLTTVIKLNSDFVWTFQFTETNLSGCNDLNLNCLHICTSSDVPWYLPEYINVSICIFYKTFNFQMWHYNVYIYWWDVKQRMHFSWGSSGFICVISIFVSMTKL